MEECVSDPTISNGITSSTDECDFRIPGFKSMDDFTKAGFAVLMESTKASNALPSGQRWDYYSSFGAFPKLMTDEGNRVIDQMSLLLHHQGIKGNIARRDLEEKFEMVVDANDTIIERLGCNLDELAGIRRNPEPLVTELGKSKPMSGSWNKNLSDSSQWKEVRTRNRYAAPVRLINSRVTHRPQLKFKDKVDNRSIPFEPRIKEKPNSLKPLAILVEQSETGECFSHPYEYELERFTVPEKQLQKVEPQPPNALQDTPLIYVANQEALRDMMLDLRQQQQLAVDVEHHSYRSFQGFTCLLQISTTETDYIVDTLELRDQLHVLNQVFTKPSVLKVFHGADCDVEWLQRDLSIYIVNMFDTQQAAKTLNLTRLGLSFLLKQYCDIDANKHFQLYDWRSRPLSEEAVKYAREDTHYLFYIADNLRNLLLDEGNGNDNILRSVYQKSTLICKKRYCKFELQENSHLEFYRRSKKLFDNRQLYALKELYRWRDSVGRTEDESTGYVLPNHMLLRICEELPREMQGILACCVPIPPLVRQNVLHLHQLILNARQQPLVKPVIADELRRRPRARAAWLKVNLESALHCPHDLSRSRDFRDDLPTLLGTRTPVTTPAPPANLVQPKPAVSLFEDVTTSQVEKVAETEEFLSDRLAQVMFVYPFERYKLVQPFARSQEEEEREAEQRKEEKKESEAQEKHRILERERALQTIGIVKQETDKNVALRDQMHGNVKRKSTECVKDVIESVHSSDNTVLPCLKQETSVRQGKSKSNVAPSTYVNKVKGNLKRKSSEMLSDINEVNTSGLKQEPPDKKGFSMKSKVDSQPASHGVKVEAGKMKLGDMVYNDVNKSTNLLQTSHSVSQKFETKNSSVEKTKKKKRGRKRGKISTHQNTQNAKEKVAGEFQTFDYNKVNFNQLFPSTENHQPNVVQKLESKFNNKGKKKKYFSQKKNNKSFTFTNAGNGSQK